jgi:DNA-binding transcriptional LysR family regulator
LHLTQPAVSRRVERLEKSIGVRLVERLNNGATLTRDGLRIVKQLLAAQSAIAVAVDSIRSPRAIGEPVRLSISDSLAAYWMARFLPAFFEHHPHVELRAHNDADAEIYRRMQFDLAIQYKEPSEPRLTAARLGTLHFVPYATKAYLRRFGRPRTPADLARHRLLDYALHLTDPGSWPARGTGHCAHYLTNSGAALGEAVRHGAGIALLPTFISVFEPDVEALDVGIRIATP